MSEALTVAEAGQRGGRARAERMTPEQRRAEAMKASLSRSASRVLEHWSELDPRQRERFRRLLQDPEEIAR